MPHGADGLVAAAGHRGQDVQEIFAGVAKEPLALWERGGVRRDGLDGAEEALHGDPVLRDPASVRLAAGDEALDLRVAEDPVADEIRHQHLTRPQGAALGDGSRREVEHAAFGGQHDESVVRDRVACRPQAVAVEQGADPLAVAEDHGCGAVPRFHQAGVVFEEPPQVGTHRIAFAPGLRHQHHHGVGQGAPGAMEQFQHVVERGRIAAAGLDDGRQFRGVPAQQAAAERALARLHLAHIAAQGVDLAVVGQIPEGLGALPGGESVGAVALMHDGQRGGVVRFLQIRIEVGHLAPHQHALVDDRAAREAGDIEACRHAEACMRVALHALARNVEPAVERVPIQSVAVHEGLEDRGTARPRLGTQHLGVHRHLAPSEQRQALVRENAGHQALAGVALARIGRQEEHADAIAPRRRQRAGQVGRCQPTEESIGYLGQDAGTVAGRGVAARGAAMQQVLQDRDPLGNGFMGSPTVEPSDETDAAGVVLEGRIIEPLGVRRVPGERDQMPCRREDGLAGPLWVVFLSHDVLPCFVLMQPTCHLSVFRCKLPPAQANPPCQ